MNYDQIMNPWNDGMISDSEALLYLISNELTRDEIVCGVAAISISLQAKETAVADAMWIRLGRLGR